jgi:hypothetical protein
MDAMTNRRSARVTLPGENQILIERHFDAPAELVYEAYTTPELVKRWWHANRGEVKIVEIDLRVGGQWRHVMVAEDGSEVGFHGEYREIVPNERLVSTEIWEGETETDYPADPTCDHRVGHGGRSSGRPRPARRSRGLARPLTAT